MTPLYELLKPVNVPCARDLRTILFARKKGKKAPAQSRSHYITADEKVLCTSLSQRYAIKEENNVE